ncbi:MAG: hypothetical protein HXY30_16045 [Pseudorhodoplanes sp.]|nr:hypothetical protein [Pseudorhodoplanes sp.]
MIVIGFAAAAAAARGDLHTFALRAAPFVAGLLALAVLAAAHPIRHRGHTMTQRRLDPHTLAALARATEDFETMAITEVDFRKSLADLGLPQDEIDARVAAGKAGD